MINHLAWVWARAWALLVCASMLWGANSVAARAADMGAWAPRAFATAHAAALARCADLVRQTIPLREVVLGLLDAPDAAGLTPPA